MEFIRVLEKAKQIDTTSEDQLNQLRTWVNPNVWTDRMLMALVKGVKRGKWFSLMDKVYTETNLLDSYTTVKRNNGSAGVDRVSIERYSIELEHNTQTISKALEEQSYVPSAIKRVYITKEGSKDKRPLGIPTVRDRIVQCALKHVIEPIFEIDISDHSYGFRPKRGCKDALREVDKLLKQGYHYIVDADIKKFFDSIDHTILINRIREKITDGRIISLIKQFLKQDVLDSGKEWSPLGTPQGAVISPLLANVFLDPLDKLMEKDNYRIIRYADDFVLLCKSLEEAEKGLQLVQKWVAKVKLTLHPDKTHIADLTQSGKGFTFLGYTFGRTEKTNRITRWPSDKSLKKFRNSVRQKTKRTNGHSLKYIIDNLNPSLRGWFEYFKHACSPALRHVESWIRMRLRSILRKRQNRRGLGNGYDNFRWSNAYFADQGLFTLSKS